MIFCIIARSMLQPLIFDKIKINMSKFDSIPTRSSTSSVASKNSVNFTSTANGSVPYINGKIRKWDNFKSTKILEKSEVSAYSKDKQEFCGGSFIGHAHLFAILTNVLLDPTKGQGRAGGENLTDVIDQKEADEYYKLSKGYFNINCLNYSQNIKYMFSKNDHLTKWMSAVDFKVNFESRKTKRITDATIFVQRYDYAHLYFTILDIYNAFIVCLVYELEPESTNIVWLDAHPKSELESVWYTPFKRVIRAGEFHEPVIFNTVIWNIMGYNSPANQIKLHTVPFVEEFREFLLSSYNIYSRRGLNCSSVQITFVWRRDYVAHPRNIKGHVQRKIKNEGELVSSLKTAFPMHNISGYQFDMFPFQLQLQFMVNTDIFIGMHGAALTYVLFLPKHGALVELFPTETAYTSHFHSIAIRRGIKYTNMTTKKGGDPRGLTNVDPNDLVAVLKRLLRDMCK